MTTEALARLARECRRAQDVFFAYSRSKVQDPARLQGLLVNAKSRESMLDHAIDEVLGQENGLFNDHGGEA